MGAGFFVSISVAAPSITVRSLFREWKKNTLSSHKIQKWKSWKLAAVTIDSFLQYVIQPAAFNGSYFYDFFNENNPG